MDIYNTGVITANKPFDDETKAIVSDKLGLTGSDSYVENDKIYLNLHYSRHIDNDISDVIDEISGKDYILNGEVAYSGDYDGKVYINDNNIESYAVCESSIIDADDETLIKLLGADRLVQILESQGYTVEKN